MNYESLLELVKTRRSIKKFKPDPVPDEYVDKIIEVARWAPSGANSQPWEFIVVRNQELRESLISIWQESSNLVHRTELTREPETRFPMYRKPPQGRPRFADAPVFIVVCGDPRTRAAYPLSAFLNRGPSIYNSSLASVFLYIHLAATTLGLGSQWLTSSGNPLEASLIKQLLGIPLEMDIYDVVALGYPDVTPKPRLVRAREEMVHYDHYDKTKLRTEQQVKDFIATLYGGGPF